MVTEIFIEGKAGEDNAGTLYLTDDLKLLRELQGEGKPAAAVLTEENRREDFSDIPYAVERIEELEQEDYERLYRRLMGMPWEILETKRCRLREMTEADVDALYEIYRDSNAGKYMEELFADRDEERRYTRDYRRYVYEFYGYGIWIVEEKNTGRIIGRAGLDPKENGPELGYVIAPAWQHQGIAFEVCSAVLEYAEREIGCPAVYSLVQKENQPSIKLLERLGFYKTEKTDKTGMLLYEKNIRKPAQ